MKGRTELLKLLAELQIPYETYEHVPVYTVQDVKEHGMDIPGAHCKNLLLKDGEKNLYLLVALDYKKLNLPEIARRVGTKRMSFASSEVLEACLGIQPGSVTPFALMNDRERVVQVLLDNELMDQELAAFHPLVNTATLTVRMSDLLRFMDHCGQARLVLDQACFS